MTEVSSQAPWWDTLPPDFYRRKDSPRMPASQWPQIGVSAVADRLLRTGLGVLMSAALASRMVPRAAVAAERELLRFYADAADRGDTEAIFAAPDSPEIRREPLRRGQWGPRGIPAEYLRFESDYKPLCPSLRGVYPRQPTSRTAHAQHWTHPDGPRPTLVFLHGYTLSSYAVNSWGFSLPWFYKKGYNIVLYTLPFHGARRAWNECYSGQGYFSGGLAHMNEAMLNAIYDVRVLLDYLLARGAPSVGVSGLSLGGYLTALLACVEPRLAFAIPNSPVVTPIDMALEWKPTGPFLRQIMRHHDISLRELRHGTALHSPLTWKPVIDPDRLMIIGGAGDRFTPPRFVSLLHEHWLGSHLHWFPGNHILHLQQAEYLRLMKKFMDRNTREKRK